MFNNSTTIVGNLADGINDAEWFRKTTSDAAAAREFSLAITAMEEAQMRLNRAFAKDGGQFDVADVQLTLRRKGRYV